jgi:hypothetical protein
MGGHFATHSLNEDGPGRFNKTKKFQRRYFSTAGQMPRLLGLAQASKIYRQVKEYPINQISRLKEMKLQGTIGNTSTSEGLFLKLLMLQVYYRYL